MRGELNFQTHWRFLIRQKLFIQRAQLVGSWLGREGSNLRMSESKSAALPLGYAPTGRTGTPRGAMRPARTGSDRSIEGLQPFQQAGISNFAPKSAPWKREPLY